MPLDTEQLKRDLLAIGKLEAKKPPDHETPITMLVAALAKFVRSGEVKGVKVQKGDAAELPQIGSGRVE